MKNISCCSLAAIKYSFFMESSFLSCLFQGKLRKRQKSKEILINSWKLSSAVPAYFTDVKQGKIIMKKSQKTKYTYIN